MSGGPVYTQRCQYRGCDERSRRGVGLCNPHWKAASKAARKTVLATWLAWAQLPTGSPTTIQGETWAAYRAAWDQLVAEITAAA